MLNLESVFGHKETPVATTTEPVPGPSVDATSTEPGGPDDIHPLDKWLAQQDWKKWKYVDGRYVGPDARLTRGAWT